MASMRRLIVPAVLLLAVSCGDGSKESSIYDLSRNPVSVRGWVLDVKGAQRAETPEMEIARRTELFQSISVWVENAQYASGGIAGNGAFIVLDVPPRSATVAFDAPGAANASIVLVDVPSNADVFLPNVVLEPGGASFADPTKLVVRLPAEVDKARPTGRFATINGQKVPIVETPIAQMVDRREYPNPGGFRPVATVK